MAPKISVVINNFNYAKYLGGAIESALGQDFPEKDAEVIVVDDGSTDGSREVIESFGDRIRPVFQSNQGQAAALNAGFAAARGEIVCLLDSDDGWSGNKLSRVWERFSRDDFAVMVQHWMPEVDDRGRRLARSFPEVPESWTEADFVLGRAIFTGTSGLSFRRRLAENILPIPSDLRICADEYLYNVVFLAPVGNIPESLGFRRVHGSNRYAVRYGDPRRIEEHLRARAVLRRELQKQLDRRRLRMAPSVEHRWRLEECMDRFFLSRYRRDWSGIRGAWRELNSLLTGRYAAFKRATLCLALVSPALYAAFYRLYSRQPWVVSLRYRLFSE